MSARDGAAPPLDGRVLLEGCALSASAAAGRHLSGRFTRPGDACGARPPSSRLRPERYRVPGLSTLPRGDSRRQTASLSLVCLPARPTMRGGARRRRLPGGAPPPTNQPAPWGAYFAWGRNLVRGSPHPWRPAGAGAPAGGCAECLPPLRGQREARFTRRLPAFPRARFPERGRAAPANDTEGNSISRYPSAMALPGP